MQAPQFSRHLLMNLHSAQSENLLESPEDEGRLRLTWRDAIRQTVKAVVLHPEQDPLAQHSGLISGSGLRAH